MLGNKDDLSAFGTTGMTRDANFVPVQFFTMFGKLPSTSVCTCVKGQCTGQAVCSYMLSSLSALPVCSNV